jgi:hypothetical protein
VFRTAKYRNNTLRGAKSEEGKISILNPIMGLLNL